MKRDFTPIVQDIPGAEGPVFDLHGRFLMVAPNRGQLLEVTESGQVTEFANTGGIPAGCQCDPDNYIWIADMKLGVLKVSPQGEVIPVVTEFAGEPMRGCNDCAFDSQGNLYVTAPAGSSETAPVGEVYCRLANGSVRRLDGGYRFCNGIAVSADDSTLIVAETFTKHLWGFDIVAPGQVANKRVWATLPGDHQGGPDGMDFDAAGNLLVANWGGGSIDVFRPSGDLLERVEAPFAKPSNVHFGGPEGRWVYVTEHDNNGLWKFLWDRPGQPQYCQRKPQ